ncbi:uncharacterized protein CANTADRAFT_6477 [Suhomyces tanzawaensis NRRL Y-17324]|uniref:Defective in cullin neddylation protein n=1 Tax=Suhomyces tanzawaensis NRRL Y-17324 TaxID=984487 RepID=A0A1E4SIM3_9ASCO|nr:uncharacterized protein CANTADRAFT_6477 [Suhomyces tanzawaensis NRRL Y-17324]ODV79340.1 hypothetical protein CANTADRAFT_6477 [Suhomyces tanzawaensis NRRL Y-17324]
MSDSLPQNERPFSAEPRYSRATLQQQFVEITNTNVPTATKYLELHEYNLNKAIDGYLSAATSTSKKLSRAKPDPKIAAIFDKYKDASDPDKIDINGTLQYLEDLGIEPEDPLSLTLAYFLHSPSVGVFLKSEFLARWNGKASDLPGMSKYIKTFHENTIHSTKDQDGDEDFHKLYDFTFGFLMELENQKLLDYELAIEYWKLLLPIVISVSGADTDTVEHINKRTQQWYDFVSNEYTRAFSKDSWSMFYLFFKEIVVSDPVGFKDYDEMAAWPSVMDEYIEYLKENELLNEPQ